MLGAISARLGREKVREQFVPAASAEAADAGSFAARLTAVASERRLSLLLCLSKKSRTVHELAGLCPALAPAVERLVNLVLSTPSTREAT